MTAGSSMLAMILSVPPQRAQVSISTPNTRFSRRAQLSATCRGSGLAGSQDGACSFGAPIPLRAGVTTPRSRLCGAKTPWYPVRCIRGGGTSAVRRAIRSSGSSTMCVVPSWYGVLNW